MGENVVTEIDHVPGTAPVGTPGLPPVTVVTGADRPYGAVIAALLTQLGTEVVSLDSPVDDQGDLWRGIPALVRLVSETGAGLVVPTLQRELVPMAAARPLFAAVDATVMVAGPGPIALVQDRLCLLAHLRSRRIPVPDFLGPQEIRSPSDALRRLGGRALALPRPSASARRRSRHVLTSADDPYWAQIDETKLLMASPICERYQVLIHRPTQGSDGRSAAVVHDPIGPEGEGAAPCPTASTRAVRTTDDEVERVAMAAVRAVGITGPSRAEVRRDGQGAITVTDVVPLFGRHLRLAPELLTAALLSP